jgi:hypothetical protein
MSVRVHIRNNILTVHIWNTWMTSYAFHTELYGYILILSFNKFQNDHFNTQSPTSQATCLYYSSNNEATNESIFETLIQWINFNINLAYHFDYRKTAIDLTFLLGIRIILFWYMSRVFSIVGQHITQSLFNWSKPIHIRPRHDHYNVPMLPGKHVSWFHARSFWRYWVSHLRLS